MCRHTTKVSLSVTDLTFFWNSGDCTILRLLDPVKDMDALCKLYHTIRAAALDAITAERTRVLMGFDDLMNPVTFSPGQQLDNLVRATLAIMRSHVQLQKYMDEKGTAYAPPGVSQLCIQAGAGLVRI